MADETSSPTEMAATEEPTVETGKSYYMSLINAGFDSRKKCGAGPLRNIFSSHVVDIFHLMKICFHLDILTSETPTVMADETSSPTEMVVTEELTVETGKSYYMSLINVGFDSRKKSGAGPLRNLFFLARCH